jgi:hypothetical protein
MYCTMRRYRQSQVAFPKITSTAFVPGVQYMAITINTGIAKQSIRGPQVRSGSEVRRLLYCNVDPLPVFTGHSTTVLPDTSAEEMLPARTILHKGGSEEKSSLRMIHDF